MTTNTNDPAAADPAIKQFTLAEALFWQVAPGFGTFAGYLIFLPISANMGFPNMMALSLAIIFFDLPIALLLLRYHSMKEFGKFSWKGLLPYREPFAWWKYFAITIPVIIWSMLWNGLLTAKFGEPIRATLFAWVPSNFVLRFDPSEYGGLDQSQATLMGLMMLLGPVLAGSWSQTIWHRGFVLPRMAKFGRSAPVYNALFFAIFHIISPWNWPGFFLMTLPWAILVHYYRNIKLGLAIHMGLSILGWSLFTMMLLSPR